MIFMRFLNSILVRFITKICFIVVTYKTWYNLKINIMFNLALSTNDLEKRWKIATTAKIKTCLHPHIQNYDYSSFH